MGDLERRLNEISVAPRVTEADVLASIGSEFYTTAFEAVRRDMPDGEADEEIPSELKVITLAIITTKTGFTVIGVSGCADPANFNKEIGQEIAKRNAVSQLWGHMGFELRTKLHEEAENRRRENEMLEAESRFGQIEHAIGSMDE